MGIAGYCERHSRQWEFVPKPGGWDYECPNCRKEGFLDVVYSNRTEPVQDGDVYVSNTTSSSLLYINPFQRREKAL